MPDSASKPPVLFSDLGLGQTLLKTIIEQGYDKPTPIQEKTIPLILAGNDLLAAAQTGTGKTASFSLPIIEKLIPFSNTSTSPAKHLIRALILVPTRELADQVAKNISVYSKHTNLKIAVIFGGVDIRLQSTELRQGVEILIATPGRLLDHIDQKTIYLNQVQMLVLDEADRMLDMGFLPDLNRIISLLPIVKQTLLFSATFSNEIRNLSSRYLNNFKVVDVANRNTTSTQVKQIFYKVDLNNKNDAIQLLIEQYSIKQTIIFCNSKTGASKLTQILNKLQYTAKSIHGDKTQSERMEALQAFKDGEISILIATDVAARGLDIADLPMVINYDLPHNAEDYVHRVGRTGRAGASGMALSLFCSLDQNRLANIEKLIGVPIKLEKIVGLKDKLLNRSEHQNLRNFETNDKSLFKSNNEAKDEIFSKPYVPSKLSNQSLKTEKMPSNISALGSTSGNTKEVATKNKVFSFYKKTHQLAALLGGGIRK